MAYQLEENQNPNYIVYIYIGNNSNPVMAKWMPEQLCFSSQSQWNDIGSSLLSGMSKVPLLKQIVSMKSMFEGVNNVAGAVAGAKLNTKYLHFLAWAGNNPLEISLDLQFNAYRNPQKEVIDPIKNLLACTMPTNYDDTGYFITPPGPKLSSVLNSSTTAENSTMSSSNWIRSAVKAIDLEFNKSNFKSNSESDDRGVTLRFGNFMIIGNLVVQNVNPKFDTMFTSEGLPISAECNVSFKMVYPPTLDDLENMFIVDKTNRTGSNK